MKRANGTPIPPESKPPTVKNAYCVRHKIEGAAFTMYRDGPVAALQRQLLLMLEQLDQLPAQSRFGEFVAAGRKHGVRLALNIFVEEPADG